VSLDKAIAHGKEYRREYRKSKRFDRTCRNHGGGKAYPCPVCERNRLHFDVKSRGFADILLKEPE